MVSGQIVGGWLSSEKIYLVTHEQGAYGILIRLDWRLNTTIGSLGGVTLSSGSYLYLGSAYGSGGLRARLRRHLRVKKSLHWHIDRVTAQGKITNLFVSPHGLECGLVRQVLRVPGVNFPVKGFGSSDCKQCPAHFLRIPDPLNTSIQTILSVR